MRCLSGNPPALSFLRQRPECSPVKATPLDVLSEHVERLLGPDNVDGVRRHALTTLARQGLTHNRNFLVDSCCKYTRRGYSGGMKTKFTIGGTECELTTEHAASSYGQPVLVIGGVAHGWGDDVAALGGVSGGSVVAHALTAGLISQAEYDAFAGISKAEVDARMGWINRG